MDSPRRSCSSLQQAKQGKKRLSERQELEPASLVSCFHKFLQLVSQQLNRFNSPLVNAETSKKFLMKGSLWKSITDIGRESIFRQLILPDQRRARGPALFPLDGAETLFL